MHYFSPTSIQITLLGGKGERHLTNDLVGHIEKHEAWTTSTRGSTASWSWRSRHSQRTEIHTTRLNVATCHFEPLEIAACLPRSACWGRHWIHEPTVSSHQQPDIIERHSLGTDTREPPHTRHVSFCNSFSDAPISSPEAEVHKRSIISRGMTSQVLAGYRSIAEITPDSAQISPEGMTVGMPSPGFCLSRSFPR